MAYNKNYSVKKVPPSRPLSSPPLETGSDLIPLSQPLVCIYSLNSFSFQMPLLSWKLPTDLTKSLSFIRWKIWKMVKPDRGKERQEKTHKSQNNLAMIQQQKSFPHFRAHSRQQEERRRPAPTVESFKTNETLCVSRVDPGPAQTHHVHHSLDVLCASGTSAVWNRTGSSLILSSSLLLRLDWSPNAFDS